jgi:protein tyrosine/serine phosphatase/predicted nucleotidyltransferase
MLKLKQYEIIPLINKIFKNTQEINSALLIGSFGRKTPTHSSDIDYQIVVSDSFNYKILIDSLEQQFTHHLNYVIFLDNKNKLSLYMYDYQIVVEIIICKELKQLDKYFLGSEIESIQNSIIFDKSHLLYSYLTQITKDYITNAITIKKVKILYLITEFQSRFEALSREHSNSDGYKYGVLFSHALNALVRIIYLCESDGKYEYMPKNFLTDYSYKLKLNIEKLSTMNLQKVNKDKRMLLDLFIQYLSIAIDKFSVEVYKNNIIIFLENIYKRDFFWNYRDMSKFNNKLKNNLIFRSTALCLIEEKTLLEIELNNNNITTIIDLRAIREVEEVNYDDYFKKKFKIINVPFDPWVQNIEFKNMHNNGTNIEIAYKFFSYECKHSIKKVISIILDTKNSIVIHCYAGKDRTGIFFTILHMLVNTQKEVIYTDYLASKMDTKKEYIDIFIDVVDKEGGINNYLKSCDLSNKQISDLRNKVSAR